MKGERSNHQVARYELRVASQGLKAGRNNKRVARYELRVAGYGLRIVGPPDRRFTVSFNKDGNL